jgi:protein-arginine kinase activator protein McsA
LAAVREGIEEIEDFFHRFGEEKMTTKSNELAVLRAMAGEIEARIPKHPLEKLHDALEQAVSEERYEEAAAIRDKISRARGNRARW